MIEAMAAALQMMDFSTISWVFAGFFIVVVIIIGVVIARMMSSGNQVQRPLLQSTAFPPPPPPDTVMVKCEYCGTQQIWKGNCVKCGAPLPKPSLGEA